MTANRRRKLFKLASNRQIDVGLILEHVHDMHNASAVVRTCDAVGIPSIAVIHHPTKAPRRPKVGKYTSAGARKWVEVYQHDDLATAVKYFDIPQAQILATSIADEAISIYDVDLCRPTIFILGNEKEGITDTARSLSTQLIAIPQHGMVQSLNISVACAIILYEMMRQREVAGLYHQELLSAKQQELLNSYMKHHNQPIGRRVILPEDRVTSDEG